MLEYFQNKMLRVPEAERRENRESLSFFFFFLMVCIFL